MAAYFALAEGLLGASVGKWIFELEVTDVEGGRPGVARASVRCALFVLTALAPFMMGPSVWALSFDGFLFVTLFRLLAPFALFLTARSHNGFAGFHDLVSGTRVTSYLHEPKRTSKSTVPIDPLPSDLRGDSSYLPRHGPYVLLQSSDSTASAGLGLGFDPSLKRLVWIREMPGVPP